MILEGSRNSSLSRIAIKLKQQGLNFETIEKVLSVINAAIVNPRLSDREIFTIAKI
jgi:hypothetical protein